jgi:hypothetical protein
MYDSIMDLFQVIGYPDRGRIHKVEDYYQRILLVFFFQYVLAFEQKRLGKSDVFVDFGLWKILFELKVLVGKNSVTEGDPKLMNGVIEDVFFQAKTKCEHGLLPDVIFVLIFNSSTRTLFPRHSIEIPFYESVKSQTLPLSFS